MDNEEWRPPVAKLPEDKQAKIDANPSRTYPARFEGQCGFCGGTFDEGDPVKYREDRLMHEECADSLDEEESA